MSKSYSKKFDNRLKYAAAQAKSEYETKKHSLNKPLEGF